jgi:cysteinyl-tRNA synthetase
MKITDTLSGQKKEFKPLGDTVTMYVCGINPYSDSHIGHGMSYIFFDVVRRYLEFRGYKVKHVENITDVEDNIINHANRLGITVKELTEKYAVRHFEDMDALNNLRPHFTPKATETIPEIIAMTQGLIDKGFGYAVGENVYFRVRKVPDYGKLSKRSLEQMMAGARVEASEAKEDPMDFVLWKESKPDEPAWDSPWGKGRPGWHIECSAMSLKFLGEQIDIHGGGQDLVFPHHENEIVQSESFTGNKPFVRYWMHNGLLRMGEDKMSKSLGNLITIREALKKYSADAIRIFVLSSYYRTPLTYTEEALEAAQGGAERLQRVANKKSIGGKGKAFDAQPYHNRFVEAMDDDFDTPQAIATLFDLARDINKAEESGMEVVKTREMLNELGGVLGLTFKEPEYFDFESTKKYVHSWHETYPKIKEGLMVSDPSIGNMVNIINNEIIYISGTITNESVNQSELTNAITANIGNQIELRNKLREIKHFQLADLIRNGLAGSGIALEDTPTGTVWKRKR